MNKTLATALTVVTAALALGTATRADSAKPTTEADATYKDIEQTLGLVPTFLRAFPAEGIAAAWDELKTVQLNPHTALNGKTKELIGLAVAAQIPCRYCTYFHTNVARLNGATDQEIQEAIAMAAITRHWSTMLNGLQTDEAEFKKEVSRVFAYVVKPTGNNGPAIAVVDAPSAYKDIERTLGLVPSFLRTFPEDGIAAAWRELKTVQLNPNTALPGKTKELIGLAVAAQIPCKYCIYFHTEAAKLNGASDKELREAVAMAALTRHWSTVLNGAQIDEAAFRKEVEQIVTNARKALAKR